MADRPKPTMPMAHFRQRIPFQKFDPQGSDYDHSTQALEGMEHDQQMVEGDDVPHNPSRVPRTGMLLKGRNHATFDKGVEEDRKMGYGLEMRDGRYYTQPFKPETEQGMSKGGLVKGCKHHQCKVIKTGWHH